MYYLYHLSCQSIGFLHGCRLGIDADNRLSVALAQVYPAVCEVYLHAVLVVHALLLVYFLHLGEDGIYVDVGGEVDSVLGYAVVVLLCSQFAHGANFVCEVAEEQRDTY